MVSTKPVVEAILQHESLFRNVVRDAKARDAYFPSSINPDAPLEELLQFVPPDTRRPGPKIYVFSVGPSAQLFCDDIAQNHVVLGYEDVHILSGSGAILLYERVDDIRARYVSDILRSCS